MKVLVFINPVAGIPRDRQRVGEQVVGVLPDDEVQVVPSGSRSAMLGRLAEEVERGVGLVVAAGGDGTVHDVASVVSGTGSALGIVPIGSGNGFARGLGIGGSPRQALAALRSGLDVEIDVGEVNGEPFFCVSGLGFDALVGESFSKSRVRGFFPYLGIAAKESLQYKPVEVSLRMDDREIVAKVFLVTVANTRQFGSGAIIAPDADPTDGLLDVVVIRNLNALEVLLHTPKLFDGSIGSHARVEIYRCRSLRILRSHLGPLHVDGEPIQSGPVLEYTLRPRAIRVRLPRGCDPRTGR